MIKKTYIDNLYRMKKKKSSIGCLFWIALILFILVIFLFSRSRIEKVMEVTGFLNFISNTEDQEPEVERIVEAQDNERPVTDNTNKTIPSEVRKDAVPEIMIDLPETDTIDNSLPVAEKNMRTSTLYFVNIGNENNIVLQGITRPIYYNESPLTETLAALLSGLTSSELNKGLLSLIPKGTKIRGITVSNRTATIDFNEALSFNKFGREGLEAELKQIIFTATEFSTVDKVQILINGQKKQFLSTEGVFIGEPLTRASMVSNQ